MPIRIKPGCLTFIFAFNFNKKKQTLMKQIHLILVVILWVVFTGHAQNNVGFNDNNSNVDASSMLDINSTSKGMLIPRLAFTSATITSRVTSPVANLLMYNMTTSIDVIPCYYFWDGSSKWMRLSTNVDPSKYNLVTKSGNSTLLKTENMIFYRSELICWTKIIWIQILKLYHEAVSNVLFNY